MKKYAHKLGVLIVGMALTGGAIAHSGYNHNSNGKSGGWSFGHMMGYGGHCYDSNDANNSDSANNSNYENNKVNNQRFSRELTAKQVKTLAEAKLIKRGSDYVKVGDITTTENGYDLSIVTKKSGDTLRVIHLDSNGQPL